MVDYGMAQLELYKKELRNWREQHALTQGEDKEFCEVMIRSIVERMINLCDVHGIVKQEHHYC